MELDDVGDGMAKDPGYCGLVCRHVLDAGGDVMGVGNDGYYSLR